MDIDINAKLPIIKALGCHPGYTYNNNNTNNNNNNNTANSITFNNIINNSNSNSSTDNDNHFYNSTNNNGHQLELPVPSFRKAENYDYRKRTHTASQLRKIVDGYHYYEEPTPEQLFERVEYDMDEQDEIWLKQFNANTAVGKFKYEVLEADFEKIMDRLEKESFFESKQSGTEPDPEVDDDAVCAICDDGQSPETNQILFCDMCNLAVHQECYGVPYVPEGQWLCRRCLQSPSRNVDCILCPNKGGAFKQTEDNRWAHVICALWIPEVCFANSVFLEPIDNIDQIPSARWKLTCFICKQKKKGACIQCHKPNCYVPFHVTCAQQANWYMKIKSHRFDTPEGPVYDVKREAFCDLHQPSDADRDAGMYSDDETDVSDDYRKWKHAKRENMKQTRKILAVKRTEAFNPTAEPRIKEERLLEISKLLTVKRKIPENFDHTREQLIRNIHGYWLLKRNVRNGVPLLRRLQVSYNNSSKANAMSVKDLDKEEYTRLRYDLERARLLVGEVKKRELLKKRLFRLSKEVVEMRYKIFDNDNPPIDDDE